MHFFIDEAGNFIMPAKKARYSCIGSLTVPTSKLRATLETVRVFKHVIGLGNQELKGGRLTAGEVSGLIKMISHLGLVFEIVVFDAFAQDVESLERHRAGAANGVTQHLTDAHHSNLKADLFNLRGELEALPNQLFIQATLSTMLIQRALIKSVLYFAQRTPEELGVFSWQMDPKCDRPSKRKFGGYDRLFHAVVKPWLQSASAQEPLLILEGADYSHFDKFRIPASEVPHIAELSGKPAKSDYPSVTAIMRDFTFPSSKDSLGLQLVDALTTAVKRVLNRSLHPSAIEALPAVMVQSESGQQPLSVMVLGTPDGPETQLVQDDLLRRLALHTREKSRRMLPPGRQTAARVISKNNIES